MQLETVFNRSQNSKNCSGHHWVLPPNYTLALPSSTQHVPTIPKAVYITHPACQRSFADLCNWVASWLAEALNLCKLHSGLCKGQDRSLLSQEGLCMEGLWPMGGAQEVLAIPSLEDSWMFRVEADTGLGVSQHT